MNVEAGTFEHLSQLVYRLSHAKSTSPSTPSDIFRFFLTQLPSPLPPKFGIHLFRLLFPHFTPRRRYQMKETILARKLCEVMDLNGVQAGLLRSWNEGLDGRGKGGCLGDEIQRIAFARGLLRDTGRVTAVSLEEIDTLLDELASHSTFSQLGTAHKPNPRPQNDILYSLYIRSSLSPYSLSLLTQIILNDLRPILQPLPPEAYNFTTALLKDQPNVPQLDVYEALNLWDWEARGLHRVWGDLDRVLEEVERRGGGAGRRRRRGDQVEDRPAPVPGINVEIPKCEKGRSLHSAIKMIASPDNDRTQVIWAETKYDGIRMQIHVWHDEKGEANIRIFSKSKRDSTMDRYTCHSMILASLGLPIRPGLPRHPRLIDRLDSLNSPRPPLTSAILEAELLPYNEMCRGEGRGSGIEEFWNLSRVGEQSTGRLPVDRHFFLSHFDILHLNGVSLLNEPYAARRKCLEDTVVTIPGFTQVADRQRITVSSDKRQTIRQLEVAFAMSNSRYEEGLVLKAENARYNCPRLRWVKLKRDYIPGLGDCIDMAIIAMGWDKERARELRGKLGTSVLTTFYAAVLTNPQAVRANQEEPHFECLFTISYGLTRQQLEEINRAVQLGKIPHRQWRSRCPFKRTVPGLSYRFSLRIEMQPPVVIFTEPLNFELMGAGFQKLPGSKYHELRWPRVQKVHQDRSWAEALDGPTYHTECKRSLGHLQPTSPASSGCSNPLRPDSLTRLFRTQSEGGLDTIEWSPLDFPARSPKRVKIESLSPRKRLQSTMSMPATPAKRPVPTRIGQHQELQAITVPRLSALQQSNAQQSRIRTIHTATAPSCTNIQATPISTPCSAASSPAAKSRVLYTRKRRRHTVQPLLAEAPLA